MLPFPTSQKKYPSIRKETFLENNYLQFGPNCQENTHKKFKSTLAIGAGPLIADVNKEWMPRTRN
jgi:hypothetical protein